MVPRNDDKNDREDGDGGIQTQVRNTRDCEGHRIAFRLVLLVVGSQDSVYREEASQGHADSLQLTRGLRGEWM